MTLGEGNAAVAARDSGGERRVLILGYGNPGRQDDGLGPAAAAEIEQLGLPGVSTHDNYQLFIEDAADVAEADAVWFVDAARTGPEPFEIRRIEPARDIAFSSHQVKPEVILALAARYCGRVPEAWLLGIRGYEFAFTEKLSGRARENLREAVAALIDALSSRSIADPTAAE
jgi:hydrogenase maturation protease